MAPHRHRDDDSHHSNGTAAPALAAAAAEDGDAMHRKRVVLWKAYHDFDNGIVAVVAVVASAVTSDDGQLTMNYCSVAALDDDAATKNLYVDEPCQH